MTTTLNRKEQVTSSLSTAEHQRLSKLCKKVNLRPAQVVRVALDRMATEEGIEDVK